MLFTSLPLTIQQIKEGFGCDFASLFSEDYVEVRRSERWFHVGRNGIRPYQEEFDWVGPFQNGLAFAKLGTETFKIGVDGSRVDGNGQQQGP